MTRNPQPLVEVRLYSHLRKNFKKSHYFAVRSAAEGLRAMCSQVKGFRKYLLENSSPGYRCWLGDAPIQEVSELRYPCGKLIRIVPVTAGAKSGDLGQILLGAALMGLSLYLGPGVGAFWGTSVSSLSMSFGISPVLDVYSGSLDGLQHSGP